MIILEILINQNHENLLKTLENLNSLKLKKITSVISQQKKNKSELFLKSNKITSQIWNKQNNKILVNSLKIIYKKTMKIRKIKKLN